MKLLPQTHLLLKCDQVYTKIYLRNACLPPNSNICHLHMSKKDINIRMSEKLVTDNNKICRAEEGELEFETPWGDTSEGGSEIFRII